jgi:3-oxoadipate enol-lactonase
MRVKLNGVFIDYSLDGKAGNPALVFVHGFPFSRGVWKAQVESFKKDFQVLSYDLRGMGKSSLGPAPQLLEAYVDDLIALLDKLELKHPVLCGLSMGGYIALRATEKLKDRFAALVLCDTRSESDSDEGKIKRAAGIKAIREKGVAAFCRGMILNLLAPATLKERPAVGKGLLKLMQANSADGMSNALAAMAGRSDTSSIFKDLQIPVLVISGAEDALIGLDVAKAMAARIAGATLAVIPGAGHVSNLDNPEEFNRSLGSFLKGLKKEASRD